MRTSVKKLTVQMALAALFPVGAASQPGSNSGTAATAIPSVIDAYIREVREGWKIPGLAVAIVHNDSVIAKGYGVRELGTSDPVDERTIFDAASLTKSFTATAVAALVDAGIVRWDDPVSRFLPNLTLATPSLTATLTFRDFLA